MNSQDEDNVFSKLLLLSDFADASPDLIAVLSPDRQIVYLNPAGHTLIGSGPGESLNGADFTELVAPNSRALVLEVGLPEALRGGSWRSEINLVINSGEEVPVSASLFTIASEDGRSGNQGGRYFAAIIRPIVEEKQRAKQLRYSQKLEAVSQLAGGIAHDFNNLLTVIEANAKFALESMEDDPVSGKNDLAEILKAARQANQLTDQLLAFSQRQVTKPEALDLNFAVREILSSLKEISGSRTTLIDELARDPLFVSLDRRQFAQMMQNFASNARNAMPKGGKLTINTTSATVSDPVPTMFGTIPAGDYAVLSVRDTGSGIDSEHLPHIFDPFFTTATFGRSAGLGLATVFGTVKQHRAAIDVESLLGEGTAFRIYFPLTVKDTRPEPPEPTVPEDTNFTILLAEDENGVRRIAERILKAAGYTVLAAPDGLSAVEIAKELDNSIDLLLTDMMMPGIDGKETAKRIGKIRPGIKLLFTSGYSEEFNELRDVTSAERFLPKPYTREELLQAVADALVQ